MNSFIQGFVKGLIAIQAFFVIYSSFIGDTESEIIHLLYLIILVLSLIYKNTK